MKMRPWTHDTHALEANPPAATAAAGADATDPVDRTPGAACPRPARRGPVAGPADYLFVEPADIRAGPLPMSRALLRLSRRQGNDVSIAAEQLRARGPHNRSYLADGRAGFQSQRGGPGRAPKPTPRLNGRCRGATRSASASRTRQLRRAAHTGQPPGHWRRPAASPQDPGAGRAAPWPPTRRAGPCCVRLDHGRGPFLPLLGAAGLHQLLRAAAPHHGLCRRGPGLPARPPQPGGTSTRSKAPWANSRCCGCCSPTRPCARPTT
ncbi:MAG: hypothetical protein WKG07_13975 [Hymenobacter sp.]